MMSDLKAGKPEGSYQAISFLTEIRDAEEMGKQNDRNGGN